MNFVLREYKLAIPLEMDRNIALQIESEGQVLPKDVGPNTGYSVGLTFRENYCCKLKAEFYINWQFENRRYSRVAFISYIYRYSKL